MSVKSIVQTLLPASAEQWVRDAVYRRNCRLRPEQYRHELERWYRVSTGRTLHLDDPRTMTEKINWLKLYDSTPVKGRLADKYLVREWVAQTVGEQYLVPLIGVWDSAEDVDFSSLPERYVLKASHGSGWNLVVSDASALDQESARRTMRWWLERRWAMTAGLELHYEFCEPRIICEQYLEDSTGGLRDFKFMAARGEVLFALDIAGRFSGGRKTLGTYLPDWSPAPFRYLCGQVPPAVLPAPGNLEEMLELTRRLSEDFALVRVDFYEVDGQVYFGEMTFTDGNGLSHFEPEDYDLTFGQRVTLPPKSPFKGVML